MINLELNAIKIDIQSGLSRKLRTPLPQEWIERYQNGALGEYDSHTIFYDIFMLDDCRTIVAMGPPLLNLEEFLLPATLNIDGRTLPFKTQTKYKKLLVLSATSPAQLSDNCVSEGRILFANGLIKNVRLHPPTPLQGNTVVAIQKDNKIEWIKDWINYYRSQFDIQHVVIYDNNSNAQEALITSLDGAATVIPWPFPYGLTYRSSNKFSQVGALNHLKLRYSRNSLIFNFDIDELLVCKTEKARRAIFSTRKIRFNNFFVPWFSAIQENYSFVDFPKRLAKPRNEAYKYIVHSDIPGVMDIHYFDAEPRFLRHLLPRNLARGPILPVDDAYFLHYMGITTNWKKHHSDRLCENIEATKNAIDDRSVIDVFASL